jgi:hypothetical protein
MNNQNLVPAIFSFDGEGKFKGFHNPQKNWNGWAMPYISVHSIHDMINELNGEYYCLGFDGDKLVIDYADDFESTNDILDPIEIDGEIYYDFGWLGFCFESQSIADYEESLHQEARDLMDGINYMHKWDSQLSLDEYLFEHFDGLSDAEINDIKTLLDKFDNL